MKGPINKLASSSFLLSSIVGKLQHDCWELRKDQSKLSILKDKYPNSVFRGTTSLNDEKEVNDEKTIFASQYPMVAMAYAVQYSNRPVIQVYKQESDMKGHYGVFEFSSSKKPDSVIPVNQNRNNFFYFFMRQYPTTENSPFSLSG
tara:strand:- start:213 stop:650 length:438 start_codon:yes stop_codon:yes gene_type:complete